MQLPIRRLPSLVPAILLALPVFAVGCVGQSEYDRSQSSVRNLQDQLADRDAQLSSLQSLVDSMKKGQGYNAALETENKALRDANGKLTADLANAQKALEDAAKSTGDITITNMLPSDLSSQLKALADANPDLMEYVASRGMVRLKSDVTFALGQTTLTDKAAAAIARLGAILNNGHASAYDVLVVGFTDNVPVTNPANKEKYQDNLGLSCARGASVARCLEKNGVDRKRVTAGGRGDQDFIADNAAKGNSANRRVEVYLRPSVLPEPAPAAAAPAPAPAAAATPAPAGKTTEAAPAGTSFENLK